MAMAAAPDQQQLPAGAASSSPRLRVHDTTLVPPSPSPPETSLPLTFFDIFWLNSPPVERLFLYRLGPDADVPAILSNLKTSLFQAVRVFYPLAGRLRLTPGTSNRYELYYRPGDGVAFTVAEYDAAAGGVDDDIDGLATDDPREVARIAPLVPPLPAGGAVLALQTTLLPGDAASPLASPYTTPPATARVPRTSCTPGRRPRAHAQMRRHCRGLS